MHIKAIVKQDYQIELLVHLKRIVFLFLLFAFPFNNLQAQDEERTNFYKVKLKDRTNFVAELMEESKDSLIFRMQTGVIRDLHRFDVQYFYKVQPGTIKNGKYRPNLLNYDKGFINPHAFAPKKGAVYFENTMLVWNELNAGLTDHMSLRVGFDTYGMILRLTEDSDNEYYDPIVLIAPKFAFTVLEDKWYFAISPAVLNEPDYQGFFNFRFLFLTNTFGNKNNNFTIGTGAQFFGYDGLFETFYFTFSGNIRISAKVALTTENWTVPNRGYSDDLFDYTYQLSSLGMKILGNNLNWSISFVRAREWGDSFVSNIVLVGFTLPISRGGGWKS